MIEKPLHIGVDATTWSNDRGFGRFTRELLTALLARDSGFRYTLLADRPKDAELPENVEVVYASTKRSFSESATDSLSRSVADLWRLGRAARRQKFDLFFFPAVHTYFPVPARVPCVMCYHDAVTERMPEMLFPTRLNHLLWQGKMALAKFQCSRAMTVSQASATDLHKLFRFSKGRIDVVTEAADAIFRVRNDVASVAKARAKYAIPANADLLLYVGGLNRHKNILGLLQAIRGVISQRPSTHLAIVGRISGSGFWDNYAELQSFIESQPSLGPHIHFTDYIDDDAFVVLLNSAAALVFPSLCEGFGLPAVEAMACGTPVLASDRGSLPEVVGEAGLYFDPDNPRCIADCILGFLSDDPLRAHLSELALKRAQTFSWQRSAELAEDCFKSCYTDYASH